MEGNHRRWRYKECQQQVTKYQRRFPDVPIMTSEQLVEMLKTVSTTTATKTTETIADDVTNKNSSPSIILVDVRTRQEQAVSMIPGAIPLQDLPMLPKKATYNDEDDYNHPLKMRTRMMIVLYCSVGYRSGQEARRLQREYPQWKRCIYNLDGILAYTFVEGAPSLVTTTPTTTETNSPNYVDDDDDHDHDQSKPKHQPTKRVHTYGRAWDNCANPDYETVWFPNMSLTLWESWVDLCVAVAAHCQRLGQKLLFHMLGQQKAVQKDYVIKK
jgi:rhodanese-related sulfurtransferase